MSVSIKEVLESAGYDFQNTEDALWLISQQDEFEELIETCEDVVEKAEEEDE